LNGGCEIMDSGRAFFDFVWPVSPPGPVPPLYTYSSRFLKRIMEGQISDIQIAH